jgi:hypothetical protein
MANWKDSLSDDEVKALYKYKTQGKEALSDDEVKLVYPHAAKIKQEEAPQTSMLAAMGKEAAGSVVPTLTGIPAMVKGAEYGSRIPGPPLVKIGGGLVGGLAGGALGGGLGKTAQDIATSYVPDSVKESLGFGEAQRQAEREQHPTASFIGSQLPQLLAFRPGTQPITLADGRVLGRGAQAGMGAALGGGFEAGSQLLQGEEFNPLHVGIAAGFGGVATTPWGIGKRLTEPTIRVAKTGPTMADTIRAKQAEIDTARGTTEIQSRASEDINAKSQYADLARAAQEPFTEPHVFDTQTGFSDLVKQEMDQRRVQDVIDERQRQLEFDVKRQAVPELNAAELQRREAAPSGYAEHIQAQEEAAKQQRQQRDSELAQAAGAGEQASIFEPHTNMHRAYEEVFANEEGHVRPFTFNEFKEIINNLAETPATPENPNPTRKGTSFELPEDMKTAYQNYLNHPGGGQGDLFGAHEALKTSSHKNWGDLSSAEKAKLTRSLNVIREKHAEALSLRDATGNLVDALMEQTGAKLNLMPGQRVGEALKDFAIALFNAGYRTVEQAIAAAQRVLKDGWNAVSDIFADVYSAIVKPAEHFLPGTTIPKDTDVGRAVATAREEGDSKIIPSLQSGSTTTAMKTRSTAIQTASRAVQNAMKRYDLAVRNFVFPLENKLTSLSKQELMDLHQILKDESVRGTRYDPELLANSLSIKQLEAYNKFRAAFDDALATQNAARALKGQDPVTAEEAYYSSRWQGAHQLPVRDQSGKLVWYLAAHNTNGLKRQADALAKDFPNLVVNMKDANYIKLGADKQTVDTAYSLLLDVLGRDNPEVQQLKAYFEDESSALAAATRAQEKHFQKKNGIRGFVGDRPGMSSAEESLAGIQSQLDYIKNAYYWSQMQKAGETIKVLVNDPILRDTQPNNIKYIQDYYQNALGFGQSDLARSFENVLRKAGTSSHNFSELVGHSKNLFILQKLGGNLAYLMANTVQAATLFPYLADLHYKGFTGNPAKSVGLGLTNGMAMGFGHLAKSTGAEYMSKVPTPFLKEMFLYAEENGITGRSIYDEGRIQSGFSALGAVENGLSKTISVPDMFLHSIAFSTFAQHLKDSGVYKDNIALFQHAEELTNHVLADARKQERPMIFAKFGAMGNVLDTLQTFSMNFFNQYMYLGKEALAGNVVPLAGMLALQWYFAGVKGIPYMESAYEGYMALRDGLATHAPEAWAKSEASPFWQDPKAWFMDAAGDRALYGGLSVDTGVGLTNRAAAPTFQGMVTAPAGPARETLKQAWSAAKASTGDSTARAQSALDSLPAGLQGLYETSVKNAGTTYKVGTGRHEGEFGAYKLSDINSQQVMYWRSPAEQEMRKYGLKSYKEMASRELEYDTQKLQQTEEAVQGKLIDRATSAAMKGNIKEFDRLNNIYADLTGKPIPIKSILSKGEGRGMSQEERLVKRSLHNPSRLVKAIQMENRLQQLQGAE